LLRTLASMAGFASRVVHRVDDLVIAGRASHFCRAIAPFGAV
jgi:hypothetical protein